MNGDSQLLADFFVVLLISLIWLRVREIYKSVPSVIGKSVYDSVRLLDS
jgi:hypothetical protein